MNREIKFRAWNGGQPKAILEWNFILKLPMNEIFGEMKPEKLVLMQYTGLKDKNGKEIYENDLIMQQDYKKPLEIYFCEHCTGFRARLNGYGNNEIIKDDCEIIGNIYENPNLLT